MLDRYLLFFYHNFFILTETIKVRVIQSKGEMIIYNIEDNRSASSSAEGMVIDCVAYAFWKSKHGRLSISYF